MSDTWKTASQDFNRFHQRFKRLHNQTVGYFRVVESHSDGYPHIHALMQFPSACIRVNNSIYFDRPLYAKWKALWTRGHSDYQKPRRSGIGTLSYLMKYLLKNTTATTVWSKVLQSAPHAPVRSMSQADTVGTPVQSTPATASLNLFSTHLHGVKLATWSRNFDWVPLSPHLPN